MPMPLSTTSICTCCSSTDRARSDERAARWHRVDGVEREIEQGLPHHGAIHLDGHAMMRLQFDDDALLFGLRPDDVDDVLQQRGDRRRAASCSSSGRLNRRNPCTT